MTPIPLKMLVKMRLVLLGASLFIPNGHTARKLCTGKQQAPTILLSYQVLSHVWTGEPSMGHERKVEWLHEKIEQMRSNVLWIKRPTSYQS